MIFKGTSRTNNRANAAHEDPGLLEADCLSGHFGGVYAVNEASFALQQRQSLAIVGPNGAGKTTLLNAVSGLVRTHAGSVRVHAPDGWVDLTGRPPHARASYGISRTFQHSKLLSGYSVIDQLLCGASAGTPYGLARALVRSPKMLSEERRWWAAAEAVLEELGLADKASVRVEDLPGPPRRLGDLGRALVSDPRIILLDEVAAGTTEDEKAMIVDLLRTRKAATGMGALIIEHDLDFVRQLADEVIVLVEGRLLSSGKPSDVL